jgi:putative endonuclease
VRLFLFAGTMQEYVVYVLKSLSSNRHYVGYTSNLISRFKSHNFLGKKGYTTRYRPWFVVHVEFFSIKKEAMLREKFLKSGKGREWMKNNITKY